MQNRRKLTAAFKAIFKKGADLKQKTRFAYWFSQLDLSQGKIFNSVEEEKEIEQRMEQNLLAHITANRKPLSIRFPLWFSAAAAALLFIVAAALLFIPSSKKQNKMQLSILSTGAGERKVITLSDGSVITLNNSSRLKFPNAFESKIREVSLEGEAFFDIVHNDYKPFVVKTGKIKVHVLGTSFDLKNYFGDVQAEVTVATGKVGVQLQNQKTHMLIRGQQLSYNLNSGLVVTSSVQPEDYSGWQKGELIFKNESLESICKRLERWYSVKINIETAVLKRKRINLEQTNESLQNVLKMLGKVAGFNYEITDKNVRIWK